MHTLKPLATAALALLACLGSAQAFVLGDSITYTFNAQSQGNATPVFDHASLTLTQTALGVDLTLTPNWAGGANRVDQLMFVYSGDAFSFVDGTGPGPASVGLLSSEKIDSGYVASPFVVRVDWAPSGANKFDSGMATSTWSMNGAGVSLDDFIGSASTSSNKPSPAFGVLSIPGANAPGAAGSNWVAEGYTTVQPIPEPETYALMALGLGVIAWATRRQRRQAQSGLRAA
jgi:PEP-CTERM motif